MLKHQNLVNQNVNHNLNKKSDKICQDLVNVTILLYNRCKIR
jgi:hypothetical protein